VKIPIGSIDLTLAQAATRQTDAAIDALERGEYDIALTLAGAAEGMIHRQGNYLFATLRDSPKARARFTQKEWIAVLNIDRDWLKHGGSDSMTIECAAAAFMIARAATKLEVWTPKMEAFKVWMFDHLDEL
jgi:hypothetical protein